MNEQEAIEKLKVLLSFNGFLSREDGDNAINIAIRALEEVQQYKALGTVRQVEDFIADWRRFRELGNLEELREANEKQKMPKKPNYDGYFGFHSWDCPSCGKDVIGYQKYCSHCGQRIDWNTETET